MSKKHFIAVAGTFRNLLDVTNEPVARAATIRAVRELATVFGQCNPRFQRGLFLSACGVE